MTVGFPEIEYGMILRCTVCEGQTWVSNEIFNVNAIKEYVECPYCKKSYMLHTPIGNQGGRMGVKNIRDLTHKKVKIGDKWGEVTNVLDTQFLEVAFSDEKYGKVAVDVREVDKYLI